MRRRRADRCLVRASAALDADVPEIAQQLVEEARALDPNHPELQEVEGRLLAASKLLAVGLTADRTSPDRLTSLELVLLVIVTLAMIWGAAAIEPADLKTVLKQLLTTAGSSTIYLLPSA